MMASVRSFGNRSTELAVAQLLRQHGISGWRRHRPLPGKPDFFFPKLRLAVFVDGCFWHACPTCYEPPRVNVALWKAKAVYNQARDRKIARKLRGMGVTVIRIWEHSLRKPGVVARRLERAVARQSKQLQGWGSQP
jgi:DNA mismatch endonuclease (patch repair protein)